MNDRELKEIRTGTVKAINTCGCAIGCVAEFEDGESLYIPVNALEVQKLHMRDIVTIRMKGTRPQIIGIERGKELQ